MFVRFHCLVLMVKGMYQTIPWLIFIRTQKIDNILVCFHGIGEDLIKLIRSWFCFHKIGNNIKE